MRILKGFKSNVLKLRILKGLWTFLSVADEIEEKNGPEDPPLHGAEKEAGSEPRCVSRG
jgi:hypothetical protein